jgi:hypothetical protein
MMAIAHIEPQPTDKSPPGSDADVPNFGAGHFNTERHARYSRSTPIGGVTTRLARGGIVTSSKKRRFRRLGSIR